MDPRLLRQYTEELDYLREVGAEFAARFPKVAGRLGMHGTAVTDPHVERLLEGAAFLAARVRVKLDAEFPRFTQRLLEVMYPGYLAPVPSMAIAQFVPEATDPSLAAGIVIPRGTALRSSRPVGVDSLAAALGPAGWTPCEFRTAGEVVLHPIEIRAARYVAGIATPFAGMPPAGTRASLHLRLAMAGGATFDALGIDSVRVHLAGGDETAGRLLEALVTSVVGLSIAPADVPGATSAFRPPSCVEPAGFDDAEALLPVSSRAFQGHRLLQEYFALPQRFLFVDLRDVGGALRATRAREADLVIHLDRPHPALVSTVDPGCFRLHCVPVVNLFPRRAERIDVRHAAQRFHVVADRTRPLDFEVHDVTGVTGYGGERAGPQRFRPIYEATHGDGDHTGPFFTVDREPRLVADAVRRAGGRSPYVGSEVYLGIVDPEESPWRGDLAQLAVGITCTNRDLPLLMRTDGVDDFRMEAAAPVARIACLHGPTAPRSPLGRGDSCWRLLDQLSLNHLALLDADADAAGRRLRAMLSLHASGDDAGMQRQIEGVRALRAHPAVRRLRATGPLAFTRGLAIELELDDAGFEGGSAFLLASVVARVLERHASINSFTETSLRTGARGLVHRWAPRWGTRTTL
jgi:type VI secretion system protein ImpG